MEKARNLQGPEVRGLLQTVGRVYNRDSHTQQYFNEKIIQARQLFVPF